MCDAAGKLDRSAGREFETGNRKTGHGDTPRFGLSNDCEVNVFPGNEILNGQFISFTCSNVSNCGFHMVAIDWLSRLFETMPVRGWLDLRCAG